MSDDDRRVDPRVLAQVREALRKHREKTHHERVRDAIRRSEEQTRRTAQAEAAVAEAQARVAARAAEARRAAERGRAEARARMEARFEAAARRAQQETEAQERAYCSFLDSARFSDDSPDICMYDDRGRPLRGPEHWLDEDEWNTYPGIVR